MFEVSSVGVARVDAAAAMRQTDEQRPNRVKAQIMRMLRRSKSAVQPPASKIERRVSADTKHPLKRAVPHLDDRRRDANDPSDGGMVVNMMEGLPCVVARKKKVIVHSCPPEN